MVSRLLSALDARIAKCHDLLDADCLRAERAALLARQGRLGEAHAALATIRTRYDRHPNATISAWTNLAEGLAALYKDLGPSARDKMRRAHALATACGTQRVRVLSAAWLASIACAEGDWDAMVAHLDIALAASESDSRLALARAGLVVAEAYHWCDRFDLALPWYVRARRYAMDEGDETILSALMHNMAWLRAYQARRLAVSGNADRKQVLEVLLGAESTAQFDRMVSTKSLQSLVPMLRAHVLALLDRHAEALTLFDTHFDAAMAEGLGNIRFSLLAEMAWCRARLGDASGARRDALAAEDQLAAFKLVDDSATHGRLAQVFAALDDAAAAERHQALAVRDRQLHAERQAQGLERLSNLAAIRGGRLAN